MCHLSIFSFLMIESVLGTLWMSKQMSLGNAVNVNTYFDSYCHVISFMQERCYVQKTIYRSISDSVHFFSFRRISLIKRDTRWHLKFNFIWWSTVEYLKHKIFPCSLILIILFDYIFLCVWRQLLCFFLSK